MCLESIQPGTAASPEQSPLTEFAAKTGRGDCFVASHDFVPASLLQSSANVNFLSGLPTNTPPNDELKQPCEFTTS